MTNWGSLTNFGHRGDIPRRYCNFHASFLIFRCTHANSAMPSDNYFSLTLVYYSCLQTRLIMVEPKTVQFGFWKWAGFFLFVFYFKERQQKIYNLLFVYYISFFFHRLSTHLLPIMIALSLV